MADFRKSILLAAMTIAFGVGTASAQLLSPSCVNAPSAAPELRSEGQTELTGAIVLNCTNIATGQSVNIDVLLNGGIVPITSRESPISEATLTVTPSTGPLATYPATYVATTPGLPVNDARFLGVATSTSSLQITITGIRANVNPTYVPLSASSIGSVLATVSASNGVLPIQLTGGGLFVGLVTPGLGLVAPAGTALTISGCQGAPPIAPGSNFIISIPELFPTAFKPQGPIVNQDSETGQNISALQAESGTQFAVTFNNIPAGLTFYIPETITSPVGGVAELVVSQGSILGLNTGLTLGSDPALNLSATGPLYLNAASSFLPIAAGTTVFYNVTSAIPSAIDVFGLTTYVSGTVTTPTVATTAPTVLITLAPEAIVNGAQQTNVPRFIALSTTPTVLPGFSVSGCQTTLLFPYMTNLAGFDTGFSIAATSTDPFGTFAQGGTCTLYMYGPGAPTTSPTLVVPVGAEGHNTISAVAPGFQGYVIATCPFEYAHGYAFLSNGFSGVGNGGLSEGYLALEVGNTRLGTPSTTVANGVSGGESLGH